MTQATYSIRMNPTLKSQFDELCANLGMNASTAFSIFARKAVRTRAIPFEVSEVESRRTMDLDTLSKAQLAEELDKGWEAYRSGKYHPAEETFNRVMEATSAEI